MSKLTVDHLYIATMTVVPSLPPARSTLIITGGPSLVTGTVGTDCVSCVNATIKLGKVAEMVGDADIPSSDKIGITITGNCKVIVPHLAVGSDKYVPAEVRSSLLALDDIFEGKLTTESGCESGACTCMPFIEGVCTT